MSRLPFSGRFQALKSDNGARLTFVKSKSILGNLTRSQEHRRGLSDLGLEGKWRYYSRFGAAGDRFGFSPSPLDDNKVGWYGVRGLTHSRDFLEWKNSVSFECLELRKLVSASFDYEVCRFKNISPGFESTLIRAIDSISARLCTLLDTAETCRNTHSSISARMAATETYSSLSQLVAQLNVDDQLYRPLATLIDDEMHRSRLSSEELRVAQSLKNEFERDGVHLSASEKSFVSTLHEKMLESESALEAQDDAIVDFPQMSLSLQEWQQIQSNPALNFEVSKFIKLRALLSEVSVTLQPQCVTAILQLCDSEIVRERCYRTAYAITNKSTVRTAQNLCDLIESRSKWANALGFSTYAQSGATARMSSPEKAAEFLRELSKKIAPRAHREAQQLLNLKLKLPNQSSSILQEWDVAYLMRKTLLDTKSLDFSAEREFFTLENCLNGLKLVCKRLFDIQLTNEEFIPGESWAPRVEKLALKNSNGEILGILYLDPFWRDGKFNSCSHFQVGSSHQLFSLSKSLSCGHIVTESSQEKDSYQLPRSLLTCGFLPNQSGLTHGECMVLWHEFGHALHSILSRTTLQHLSGTRGEVDFVETPSQVFEYMFMDPKIMREWAVSRSGKPIPEALQRAVVCSKTIFSGLELQRQAFYAASDLAFFSESKASKQDLLRITSDLQAEYYPEVPPVPDTLDLSRSLHFTGYGAAYYSYIYGRVFAADIWNSKFRAEPLSKSTGKRYSREILQPGGSKDPIEALTAFLERPPSIDSLIDELNEN